MKIKYLFLSLCFITLFGCSSDDKSALQFENKNGEVPHFNVDSAYAKLAAQVKMGPRNPGSSAHKKAERYLVNQLKKYAGNHKVFAQRFTYSGYKGDTLKMANIIASFNPQSADRIMLCAHWDSRPQADQDSVNVHSPILGADDGASGAAVLLELAHIFKDNPPPIGVDIILFDGEDYGKENDLSRYFVGSRFWSNHPPVKNYKPRFGILLDMVGGENAVFPKEVNSMQFAPALVNQIWSIAAQKGYDSLFVDRRGARISDDHLVINRIRKFPVIDIVRHSKRANGHVDFAPYWHTHNDNLQIIDKGTLKKVGQVLTELVYNHL